MHRFLGITFVVILTVVPVESLEAQDKIWAFESEVGASLFFGGTDQTTVATRLATERADSVFEFSSEWSFNFGQATDDTGESFVNKRSWSIENDLVYHPFANLTPFFQSRIESSFEKRIDFRYSGGIGGKAVFARDETTLFDVSVAVLAEQTFPSDDISDVEDEILARWSSQLRFRQTFDKGRITLENETFYRPEFSDFDNFTVTSESSVAFQLNSIVSLKLSLVDNFDSLAKSRGAPSNNDGQLLFSILSAF